MTDPDLATALPDYDIGQQIGRGAFGVVWSGRHRNLDRDVAIKELPRGLAADPDVRARFLREAKLVASLDHPHIVPVYDFVERGAVCVLVMELLSGGTVLQRAAADGLSMQASCAIALAACAGLAHAHEKGVLHRDVKPENLLFNAADMVKVTDFGIAAVVAGGRTLATVDGAVLGTPEYMAPEQVEGQQLGPAADVYATAVMLYELLAGRLPFAPGGTPFAVASRRLYDLPVPLSEASPDLPAPLAKAVMGALARDPADRPATASAFGDWLASAALEVWGAQWFEGTGVQLAVGVARSDAVPPPRTEEPSPPRPSAVVRTTHSTRAPRPALSGVTPAQLVPLPAALGTSRPGHPIGATVAALALTVLTAVGALAGLGGSDGRLAQTGLARVDGVDPGDARPHVDLERPTRLEVDAPPGASAIAFDLALAGLPLFRSDTVPVQPGPVAVDVPGRPNRYVAAGIVDATITLTGADGDELATHRFAVETQRRPITSVPGVVVLVGAAVLVAYTEALLRSARRRGRLRPGLVLGLVAAGAAWGVVAVALAWLTNVRRADPVTLALCAIAGAGAGLCAGAVRASAGARARAGRRTGSSAHP